MPLYFQQDKKPNSKQCFLDSGLTVWYIKIRVNIAQIATFRMKIAGFGQQAVLVALVTIIRIAARV